MANTPCLAVCVDPKTKQLVASLARQQDLTVSAWLRKLIKLTLHSADAAVSECVVPAKLPSRAHRLSFRLRHEDRVLLIERARARGMAAATYVSVFARAHLRGLAPLPEAELLALKRSVAALSAIGRNFRQIAESSKHSGATRAPNLDDLQAFLTICEALRDHIKRLLKANLESWESGHDETDR